MSRLYAGRMTFSRRRPSCLTGVLHRRLSQPSLSRARYAFSTVVSDMCSALAVPLTETGTQSSPRPRRHR